MDFNQAIVMVVIFVAFTEIGDGLDGGQTLFQTQISHQQLQFLVTINAGMALHKNVTE